MALHQLYIVIIFSVLASWTNLVAASEPNFDGARELLEDNVPNWKDLCTGDIKEEGDKTLCYMEAYSVGFLVCKSSSYFKDGVVTSCYDVLEVETNNVDKL